MLTIEEGVITLGIDTGGHAASADGACRPYFVVMAAFNLCSSCWHENIYRSKDI